MANQALIEATYEGTNLHFTDDGWFNATEAAYKYDKAPNDWLRLPSTQDYLNALHRKYGIIPYLKTKRGQHGGGTWLHPKLAVRFAQWLDIDFAIWCDEQIDALLRKDHPLFDWRRSRHEAASTNKMMCAMVKLTREEAGLNLAPYHFSNEARLVNWALTGAFTGLDRDSMSLPDLNVLAKLEEHNALLIGKGLDYKIRKPKLETLAKALLLKNSAMLSPPEADANLITVF